MLRTEEQPANPKQSKCNVYHYACCPSGHRCVISDPESNGFRAMQCAECGAEFVAHGPFETATLQ